VYKHLKKKTHLTKDVLFPHLPAHVDGSDPRKVSSLWAPAYYIFFYAFVTSFLNFFMVYVLNHFRWNIFVC
jgi:hypothetical protein